jgi:hypothetical protein
LHEKTDFSYSVPIKQNIETLLYQVWQCGIVALANLIFARNQNLGKSVSNACGIEVSLAYHFLRIFNIARFLVALWYCQI